MGLSGESRLSDGNNSYFHTSAVALGPQVRPARSARRRQPAARAPAADVPCETQEPPNLNAPGGPLAAFGSAPNAKMAGTFGKPRKFNAKKIQQAGQAQLVKYEKTTGKQQARAVHEGAQEARRSWGRRPSEARDPQAPRRLRRDPRAVRAGARASAATSCPTSACASRSSRRSRSRSRSSCPTPRRCSPARARRCAPPAWRSARSARSSSRTARPSWSCSSSPSTRATSRRTPPRCCAPRPGSRTCSSRSTRATGQPLPENGRDASRQNTAPDIDPDEVLVGARRRHARLPQAAALRRRQGPEGARLGPAGDLRPPRAAEPRPRPADQGGRAPAQEPLEPGEQVRQAHAASWAPRTGRSCGWCRRPTPCSRRSPPRTSRSRTSCASCRARSTRPSPTLAKVDTLGGELGPTLEALRPPVPPARHGQQGRAAVRAEATPQIRDQIRPFARIAAPYTADLGTAARDLNKANPDLTTSFNKLNRFFNIGAFNPNGAEGLTGDVARDRAREEGNLYWLAWTANNTVSLFSAADARGRCAGIFLGGLGCDALTAGGVPPLVVADYSAGAGVCAD